ncbi:MAG: dienelactone hydrolase family protein [Gemmatimonadaceae bacterium]|nr:dienelactone hydrolase family protein [Gemmatimonadaceae bacterium]
MIHGRNAAPANILDLLPVLGRPDFAAVAPAAEGGAWYPQSFMADRVRNEPGISKGLAIIGSLMDALQARGFPSHKIMLLGFSQGACLTAEFALRNPKRYGGVMVLSGGVIGPPATNWDDVSGSLAGTPVFLGCSDVDSHIPAERVLETDDLFNKLGARVIRKLYPGMGHLVNKDEIENVQRVMDEVLAA